MGEVLEIAKALVQPTVKLMDLVSGAIGKAYEPRHKRKMADATAYEIGVIGQAMRNAADLPVVYNQEGVAINSEDFQRLMQRAGTRLALQETIKQANIECIVDNAYEILDKEENCSQEPVEQGWINRFFDSVATVTDEDLQQLWGKVLAGEVKQPRSFSLRTLETLKNLSKHEAELFQKIASCIVSFNKDMFLTSNTELLGKYGIFYGEILELDECGLINSDGLISLNPMVSNSNPLAVLNSSKLILLQGLKSEDEQISIGEFSLTRAGKELFGLLESSSNDEYLFDLAEEIVRNNTKKVKASVHQINSMNADRVNYQTEALREYPTSSNNTD